MKYTKNIIELSVAGRKGYSLPPLDVEKKEVNKAIPEKYLRQSSVDLPEVNEVDVIRHFTKLSNKNYGLDAGFYPLGSCTMKYNPKINEEVAGIPGFATLHPHQEESTIQGALQVMYELQNMLAEVSGMDAVTLQPAAGAHGEMVGLLLIKAYHEDRGDTKRKKIIVPDSAHGTNPSSASVAGFEVVEIKSNEDGSVNLDNLKEELNDEVAGLMLTNPSTLGLFEKNIKEIADLVHEAGGLLYYDGANMNAIMSKSRPGDMGFDVMHFNLHKTFSTPHGGGGPGSGPVGMKSHLLPFAPLPMAAKDGERYFLDYDMPKSIGKVKDFFGHFAIYLRAYVYILTLGRDGLKEASEMAVLNANYMMTKLKEHYKLPIDTICKHEFVLSGLQDKSDHVTTLDVAKRILDYGFHAPTIYFPLNIPEAIMIEPTETESKTTLDEFIEAMIAIAKEAKEDPELVKSAPHHTQISRVDEVRAARTPIITWNHK